VGNDEGMSETSWRSALLRVLDAGGSTHEVVVSPDVDGLVSAALLAQHKPVRIIGAYTTSHLLLGQGVDKERAADALWLDHDVSEPGIRCVGQHLVLRTAGDQLPRREKNSFNPNIWSPQPWDKSFAGVAGKKRDKYPYGTAHFLAVALGASQEKLSTEQRALFAHADGTWRTVVDYRANAVIWRDLMFPGDPLIDYLLGDYQSREEDLKAHAAIVTKLLATGVQAQQSRAPRAQLLPPHLKALTGNQSIAGRAGLQPDAYYARMGQVARLIADIFNTPVEVVEPYGSIISGDYHSLYPNALPDNHDNFDDFMQSWAIFSHAFTDFRSLKVTKGIRLR
jgi:hypothetical protein